MKATLAVASTAVLGVTLLPALLANGDPPPMALCGVSSGPIEVELRTIRTLESGGDYTARASGSSASGAYQFLDSTWDGYAGYLRAGDAPPDVQDAKAAELVTTILDRHDGDVTAVPVIWYIGHLPAPDSAEWDSIPYPDAGNVLTPREYQQRWLDLHAVLLRASLADGTPTATTVPIPGSCSGGSTDTIDGEWALPGPRELIDADPSVLTKPHHDYPAWDWIIPINTPIYAVRGGRVTAVRQWPHNWWTRGCSVNSAGCQTCGVGVTVVDSSGMRWTYCHGTNLTVSVGDQVAAGRQVMWSGNSGRSGTPHLHLEIRTAEGERRCPQHLLATLYQRVTTREAPATRSACAF